MSAFDLKLSPAELCSAHNIAPNTLQNWLKRGMIVGHRDIEGEGNKGIHRRFTFFNYVEIGIAKALIDAGLGDLGNVFEAAGHFSHGGSNAPGNNLRLPGLPFNVEDGTTLLIAGRGWSDAVLMNHEDSAISLYAKLRSRTGVLSGTVIDASQRFNHMMRAIDLNPVDVIRAGYANADK